MRVLVTLLASFILALGLLGAGLTLLHSIPQKTPPTDPGLQWTIPASLGVMPRPIEKHTDPSGPKEATAKRAGTSVKRASTGSPSRRNRKGSLRLSGQIELPSVVLSPEEEIGLQLLREDGEVGLFLRRIDLGKQRSFRFEGLAPGQYRLQAHVSKSGQILQSLEILLTADRDLTLGPRTPRLARELRFTPRLGSLQDGALLILEDGRFFHQRIRGKAGGIFLAQGLPAGNLRYTLRGRLGPKTRNLTWKGTLSILPLTGTEAPPSEIQLSEAAKAPLD